MISSLFRSVICRHRPRAISVANFSIDIQKFDSKAYKMEVANEPKHISSRYTHEVSMRKDGLVDWMKDMLYHSFVLGNNYDSYVTTMRYIEELIKEHMIKGDKSRLKSLVPTIGIFHTELHLVEALDMYDAKYSITSRRHVPPTFNEIRHILNLSQLLAINVNLRLVSFDGDQTLYSDGGNFEEKSGLSYQIIELVKAGIIVTVITAANYEHNGPMYEVRLSGLLRRFIKSGLSEEEISRFHVMGGECHYLLRAKVVDGAAKLMPVEHADWQASETGPQPMLWSHTARDSFLDVAEASFRASRADLKIRARILRKKTSVGMIPGGEAMIDEFPSGHGTFKIKTEFLDEVVLRAFDEIAKITDPIPFPYCVFNGGRDCWVDVGTKGVAVEALQSYFQVPPGGCIHVGDQFLGTGNDISTRKVCSTIWIENPKETFKILDHVLRFSLGKDKLERAAAAARADDADRAASPRAEVLALSVPGNGEGAHLSVAISEAKVMNVYTGELESPKTEKKN